MALSLSPSPALPLSPSPSPSSSPSLGHPLPPSLPPALPSPFPPSLPLTLPHSRSTSTSTPLFLCLQAIFMLIILEKGYACNYFLMYIARAKDLETCDTVKFVKVTMDSPVTSRCIAYSSFAVRPLYLVRSYHRSMKL